MSNPLRMAAIEFFVYACLWGLLGWRWALSIFLIHWLINIFTSESST